MRAATRIATDAPHRPDRSWQGCGASSDASSKYSVNDAPPVPELSEEEKESMTKAFRALDKDGDGSLSKDEIRVRPICHGTRCEDSLATCPPPFVCARRRRSTT